MKYNDLQVAANKDRKRVGRGIAAGQGKTAGRGTKGQGARTGKKLGATFQGGQRTLVRAVPKARGFKSLRTPAQVVYLDTLNALKGKTIDNFVLFEEGYIENAFHAVKVIVRGEITEKVTLHVAGISKTAEVAVIKAGGAYVKTPVPLRQSTKEAEAADKK
ncbi:MAG: rplO [Candidatus Saccharibacteria bacterium]|nr:rplO [Candidatus Saccharibacteria bacterium]